MSSFKSESVKKEVNEKMQKFKRKLIPYLQKYLSWTEEELLQNFEMPPQADLGDLAFPCFRLSKELRKAPMQIAKDLFEQLLQENLPDFVQEVRAVGPYVNFFFAPKALALDLSKIILENPADLVEQVEEKEKPILIDFSSPNIAKPFHIGHAYATILGQVLANLYEAKGYKVLRFNHLGDYGTQFGKLIVAFTAWGEEKALLENPIQELLRVYVRFHEEAEKNPALELQAREHFRLLEQGNAYEKNLWQRFRDLSLREFEKVYRRLNISFDNYNGESFYSPLVPDFVKLLEEKNLLVESEGAKVVPLDDTMPPCLILKNDGTSIYASRDLAAAKYRYDQYQFAKNIYVVGNPQALHFKQIFRVLDLMGYAYAKDCQFVGFGTVKMADGSAMATRAGQVIFLENLLEEAVLRTKKIVENNAQARNVAMSEEEMQDIAEKVGIAAVMYTFVKNGRERDIYFSWEEMLNFEGDTSPYLQYTYARIRSILQKAQALSFSVEQAEEILQKAEQLNQTEYALLKEMQNVGLSVDQALKNHEPSVLSKQLCTLAHVYNKFYADSPILHSEVKEQDRNLRLLLCCLTSKVFAYGLSILNIQTVERM